MNYSRQRVVSDGTLQQIDISLAYFKRGDLSVLLDGVLYTDWSWAGSFNRIEFPSPIAAGVEVTVLRSTQIDKVIHNFALGSKFTSTSMDEDFLQMLYLAQEYTEGGGQPEFFTDIDMHGYKIHNLSDGTLLGDAVNLQQLNAATAGVPAATEAALAAAAAANAAAVAAGTLRAELGTPSGSSMVGHNDFGNPTTVSQLLDQITGGFVNAADPRFMGGIHGPTPMRALQAAHDWAAANYVSSTVYWTPKNQVIDCQGPDSLFWDTNKVGLDCCQEFSAVLYSGPAFMTFIQSDPNPGSRPAQNSVHPIRNMIVNGPGFAANSKCFVFQDPSVLQNIAGVTIHGGAAWGWAFIAYYSTGAFFTNFENFDFGTSNGFGGGSGTHVYMEAGSDKNMGERNVFTNCRWSGPGTYLVLAQGSASTFINGGSMNYGNSRMVYVSGGSLFMDRVHIEAESDTLDWIAVVGDNTHFSLTNSEIVIAAAKRNKSIISNESRNTGIVLDNIHISFNQGMQVPLVTGSGAVQASRISWYKDSGGVHIGAAANRLVDGGFGNSNRWVGEWISLGVPPVIANDGFAWSGDAPWSLKFVAGTGAIYHEEPITPGQTFSVRFWSTLTNIATGKFAVIFTYRDRAGSEVGSGGGAQQWDTSRAGEFFQVGWPNRAPPGAATVRVSFSFFGESSAEARVDLDVVEINVI